MVKTGTKILIAFIVGLVLSLAVSVLWGCRRSINRTEYFGLAPNPDKPIDTNLTTKERELFEDLKANKLNGDQVQKLISAGILNSYLFEKFLFILGVEEKNIPNYKSRSNKVLKEKFDDMTTIKSAKEKGERFTPGWKATEPTVNIKH